MVEVCTLAPGQRPATNAYVLVERASSAPVAGPEPMLHLMLPGGASDEQLLIEIEEAAVFARENGAERVYVRDLSGATEPAAAASGYQRGRPRILIVEDDHIVAQDISATIEELGGEVVGHASDLAEALRLAERGGADGAFVDLNLCDGFTGCAVAEAFAEKHALPVVFISGCGDQVPTGFPHALALIEKPIAIRKVEMAMALVDLIQLGARAEAA